MKRATLFAAAFFALAAGCSPGDMVSLGRAPTQGHFVFYLLLAPFLFIARIFFEAILGEAIGMVVSRLLPPWMKTRRALWTGVALLSLLTFGAVTYWNTAGRVPTSSATLQKGKCSPAGASP